MCLLGLPLASPCLGYEPKVRIATSKVYSSTLISSQESGNECPRSQWAFENSYGKRR